MNTQTIDLKISGMTCVHCKSFVTNALKGVSGVSEVEVNLETAKAHVKYDTDLTNAQNLIKSVNNSGIYTASLN